MKRTCDVCERIARAEESVGNMHIANGHYYSARSAWARADSVRNNCTHKDEE